MVGWESIIFVLIKKYEGFWLNNTMHGRGRYTWKDGRKYDGEYDHDRKHGYGLYLWNDGRGCRQKFTD